MLSRQTRQWSMHLFQVAWTTATACWWASRQSMQSQFLSFCTRTWCRYAAARLSKTYKNRKTSIGLLSRRSSVSYTGCLLFGSGLTSVSCARVQGEAPQGQLLPSLDTVGYMILAADHCVHTANVMTCGIPRTRTCLGDRSFSLAGTHTCIIAE